MTDRPIRGPIRSSGRKPAPLATSLPTSKRGTAAPTVTAHLLESYGYTADTSKRVQRSPKLSDAVRKPTSPLGLSARLPPAIPSRGAHATDRARGRSGPQRQGLRDLGYVIYRGPLAAALNAPEAVNG